ncbi:hypothetical protein OESDEN_09988 [Oesophagostomum dentatum]|uniref:Uncharacterized protein n=1 Tax=Oesophagostomum dentatum TaxID=61180 RepID=A0A0B1SY34_OESDE|nr:hypothetical protein OESDEN_09988 [Oesophagostomum dentatum]
MTSVRVRPSKKKKRIVMFELPTATYRYRREKWYRLREYKHTSSTVDVPQNSMSTRDASKKKALRTVRNSRRDKSSQKRSIRKKSSESTAKIGTDEA